MADTEFKEFGGRVPLEEFARFKKHFPQYGASNWFINRALKTFNDFVEDNDIGDAVDKAIDRMLDQTLKGA